MYSSYHGRAFLHGLGRIRTVLVHRLAQDRQGIALPVFRLAQSLKPGKRLAMFAVIASAKSWLCNMAAFQVAM